MMNLIKLRKQHGFQTINDIKNALILDTHRGFPLLDESKCELNCSECKEICPTEAIELNPLSLDLGKCIFCGECEKICKGNGIRFTSNYKIAATSRNNLIVSSQQSYEEYESKAIEIKEKIYKLFGRSLKLRQVSAGGCNGCEMELAATTNVNFDITRFGIDFVASPRHADGIVITGPITKNMASALLDAYKSIGEPKIVIAFGACAISGGIFYESDELDRSFIENHKVDLYIPGCPPHPLTFINALLKYLNI